MRKTLPTPSTRNVTAVFRSATPEQIESGIAWYADARRLAQTLAAKHGVSLPVAVGVIAACSPLMAWGANVNLADRMLASGGTLTTGYMRANLDKASAIMAGADPVTTLRGLKVTNFYLSILSGGAEGVCIDRHAFSLAVNDRSLSNNMPSLSPKRYAAAAEVYTRAARILSREVGRPISPAVVQSVTWVVWRSRFWSEGAFDSHGVEV